MDRKQTQGSLSQRQESVLHQSSADTSAMLEKIMATLEDISARLAGTRKDFYTVEEIAELTGRSAYTIRRWITEKRIHARRVAGTGPKGRLLIPRDQVDVLIASGLGEEIPSVAQSAGQVNRAPAR